LNQRRKAAMLVTTFIIFISLINIFIQEAWNSEVQASSFLVDNKNLKVVIVMADNIELQDFARNDYLGWLFNNSYSALISGRQNGKVSIAKAYLAIGTGKRLEISSGLKSIANFNNNFETLDNQTVVGENGNIIYHDIKQLRKQNKGNSYNSYIGYLGSKLKQYNKTTCVIGNSDTDIINRSSVLMAMDENGIVDVGDVENTVISDSSFPGGKRTNFNKLTSLYKEYSSVSDFIIIDTGDLARIDYYRNQLSEEDFAAHKSEAVKEIAEFTRNIIENTKQKTVFIVLSAYPSKGNLQSGLKLTPIIVYNNNGKGFIQSQSTKRTGIITNLDIADFVLEKLVNTEHSSLKEVSIAAPLWNMLSLTRKLLNISVMRLPVLTWYAIFEIICATAGFIYMLNFSKKWMLLIKLVKIIMLVNIVAPVVLLYMSVFDINNPMAYFALFILMSFMIASILFLLIKTSMGQFLGAALFVNLSIVIDLLRESTFIKNSVFGYDPIIGARFYGIGNEFAGVFIGSGILLAGCLLQLYKSFAERKPKTTTLMLIIYSCFQLYIMGMPFIGANFGGTIAGIVGYFFFYISVKQRKIKITQLILLAFIIIIALSSIVVLDLINPSTTTHVGKFITDIKDNGVSVLYSTMARKAAMNLKLIKYTIWTKVLLCIILIITIMFFKPVRLLHGIFRKYRYLTAAWLGISAGSIAGLLVNDSGIVMAATAMIFTGYTILYMCLEEMEASN
jgi:hypothetical protein